MDWYTVVRNKKTASGLVKAFRNVCLLSAYEEIPVQYRIATDRRYFVKVLNPGQEYNAFAERCERIVAKFNA